MEWQPHTKRLADDSSYDQIARPGILEGNNQRHDLEDRQITSLTRKAECDKGTAKANGKKTGRTVVSTRKTIFRIDGEAAMRPTRPRLRIHPRCRVPGVKGLSKMTTRSRKLGKLRLTKLERDLVGTQKLTLRFDHPQHLEMNNRARQREGDRCQRED